MGGAGDVVSNRGITGASGKRCAGRIVDEVIRKRGINVDWGATV
jgi:hypothetical protein